jgi:hypothetical protein
MGLTLKKIAAAKEAGRYGDGHGLYLQVGPSGTKSWLLRYERHGRERWMGLGAAHTFTLEEARDRARRARQQLVNGLDPLEARRAERAAAALEAARAMNFEQAATAYFNQHERKWRNARHRQQFLNTMRDYAFRC